MTLLAINEWWQARGFGVAVVFCFLASGIIMAGLMDVSYDDAYITYRCARNLALGHGLAYNPGESGSATTTPFFAIILAGLGWVTLVDWIPLWGAILSGISLALLGLFVLLHARQEKQMGVGWVVLVGLFVNPFLPSVWDGEALLCLALAMVAFYFYFRRCPVWAGLFCLLAFLTRGEGLLPLVIMAGHSLHRDKKLPWVEIGVVGVLLAAWWPISKWVGAGFLPHTLGAKMAQMQSGAWGPFVKTTFDWYRAYLVGSPTFPSIQATPIFLMIPVLAAIGGIACLVHPRARWVCLVVWLIGYMAGYSVLAVPFYTWYAFPVLFLGLLLAGLGVQACHELWMASTKDRSLMRQGGLLLGGLALLIVAGTGALRLSQSMFEPAEPVRRLYTKAGEWLQKETPKKASVGFFEIGFVGYYSQRRIVDPVGLVNADVSAHVAKGDFTWAFKRYEPDYILLTPVRWQDRIGKIKDEVWFKMRYEEMARIVEPGYFDASVTIFQKKKVVE